MKKIALILSGCGYLDGAEIRESVLALLYLDCAGVEVQIFAPDINQHHVINHLTKAETAESRNVLVEAARIARSDILPLAQLDAAKFDALVVAGGYGVAKNLSNLAFAGADAKVLPELDLALKNFHAAQKPIGLICIAPAVAAASLRGITVTIGEDSGTAKAIEAMGSTHQVRASDEICFDAANKIVSCSAYMREDKISAIAKGIEKLVNKVVGLL